FRPTGHRLPDLPILAGRCLVVARSPRGGAGVVRRRVGISQSLWLAVGGYRSANRDFVGKFSANLFDGRLDLDRDAAVAQLGGSILARLIVVSNRVAVPSGDSQAAGRPAAGPPLLKGHRRLLLRRRVAG